MATKFPGGVTPTGLTAPTGDLTVTAGNIVATAGNITATAGNIVATAGSVKVGAVAVSPTMRTVVKLHGTAGATVYNTVLPVTGSWTITGAKIACYSSPASALGAITLAMFNYDLSTTTEDNLLSAATVTLEGLTAKTTTALSLTATAADLVVVAGDVVYAKVVSDNADATFGDGLALVLEYQLT